MEDRNKARKRRSWRSKAIIGTKERPRVVVFKSNLKVSLQIIDDNEGKTLFSMSTKDLIKKNEKTKKRISLKSKEQSQNLGKHFALKIKNLGLKSIVFDRNGYIYHGKIKSLCEAIREEGIIF